MLVIRAIREIRQVDSENRQTDKLMKFDQLLENAKRRNFKIDKNIDIDSLMNEMNNGLCSTDNWKGCTKRCIRSM